MNENRVTPLYRFVQWINGSHDLVVLRHADYGDQLWKAGRARRRKVCRITGKPYGVGESVYAPITNRANRGDRITKDGIMKLAGRGSII